MAMASGQVAIHAREKDIVLGIDPGRDKTGFAFVDMGGNLLVSGIFETKDSEKFFMALRGQGSMCEFVREGASEDMPSGFWEHILFVAIGDGTSCSDFIMRMSGYEWLDVSVMREWESEESDGAGTRQGESKREGGEVRSKGCNDKAGGALVRQRENERRRGETRSKRGDDETRGAGTRQGVSAQGRDEARSMGDDGEARGAGAGQAMNITCRMDTAGGRVGNDKGSAGTRQDDSGNTQAMNGTGGGGVSGGRQAGDTADTPKHENITLKLPIVIINEHNTTLEARSLYWKIHTPGLLARLIPEGIRIPKRTLDDLAAWAIASRALKKYRDIRVNKL